MNTTEYGLYSHGGEFFLSTAGVLRKFATFAEAESALEAVLVTLSPGVRWRMQLDVKRIG